MNAERLAEIRTRVERATANKRPGGMAELYAEDVGDLLAELESRQVRVAVLEEALSSAIETIEAWMNDAKDGDLSPPADDDYRELKRLRAALVTEGGTE